MYRLPLKIDKNKTYIMGVLNITPDSFHDKGAFFDRKKAIKHALEMARDGADIIDIGGESTRPGAEDVSIEEELKRVIPVIQAISKKVKVWISVDTRKAKVAEEAIKNGAQIVNDVSALNYDLKMAAVIARHRVPVILMHMRGSPKDMQVNPSYKDVVKDVISDLKRSIRLALKAGIAKKNIVIDPGIGFGKTLEHNLQILRRLDEFSSLGHPICVGVSRKSFIGKLLGCENSEDRLAGTLAANTIAMMKGANILRVHDVLESVQASRVAEHIIKTGKS